jgi:hypothetical protein
MRQKIGIPRHSSFNSKQIKTPQIFHGRLVGGLPLNHLRASLFHASGVGVPINPVEIGSPERNKMGAF